METNVARVMIAGTASGVGKTTVVCGLLRALQRQGMRLRSYKCGPDYLDPQFHRAVLDIPAYNLDLYLAGEEQVRELLGRADRAVDLCLIEGAMGYYDGIAQGCEASAYDVARATETPTVLVADARGKALSLAAEINGFLRFREPSHVAAIIINRVSERYYPRLKAMVERECGVPVMGYLSRLEGSSLESRHLGLVSADEVADLQQRMDALADVMERTVDLDGLVELATSAQPVEVLPRTLSRPNEAGPVIAVARDAAFSFYYEETLELLESLGMRLAFFSPLADPDLPAHACGLYLGGGYPELHARELSENTRLRGRVRAAVEDGMPTIAECGGYLYLHQTLEDSAGREWPMAGVVPGRAFKQDHMKRFGYVDLTARCDNVLAQAGAHLRAHEFHYWQSTYEGDAFVVRKPQSDREWTDVLGTETLYAGFPHLYLNGCPEAAKRFYDACVTYGRARGVL